MNYYPFNVGDYASHTGHLEPMEDLAYRRLLDMYYLREQPFPADIQATAKLIRMRSMAADVESVLREFFVLTDAGWEHDRCNEEIEKMQDKQAKARKSAAASVNVRRANAERSLPKQQTNAQRSLPVSETDVELPTPTPISITEPKGSGGNPPAIPAELSKEELWRYAVALLGGQGVAEKQARSLIGKLSKAYSDVGGDIVATAVREAVTHQPANASEYLVATCQRLAGERGRNGQKIHDWTENAK